MDKNIKLLQETLEFIKANPKNHDQGDWVQPEGETPLEYQACETTMCFAGHAAILSGATFNKDIWFDEFDWNVDEKSGRHVSSYDEDQDVYMVHVATFASEKLGLDEDERSYLFDSDRSIQQIENAVAKFEEGYKVSWDGCFYKKEN